MIAHSLFAGGILLKFHLQKMQTTGISQGHLSSMTNFSFLQKKTKTLAICSTYFEVYKNDGLVTLVDELINLIING